MQIYKGHNCGRSHMSFTSFAECAFPTALWVKGPDDAEYAVVSYCDNAGDARTITLWKTEEEAEAAKTLIDSENCGARCSNNHRLVLLQLPGPRYVVRSAAQATAASWLSPMKLPPTAKPTVDRAWEQKRQADRIALYNAVELIIASGTLTRREVERTVKEAITVAAKTNPAMQPMQSPGKKPKAQAGEGKGPKFGARGVLNPVEPDEGVHIAEKREATRAARLERTKRPKYADDGSRIEYDDQPLLPTP